VAWEGPRDGAALCFFGDDEMGMGIRAAIAGLVGLAALPSQAEARQATAIVITSAQSDWIQIGEIEAFAGGVDVAAQSSGGVASGSGSYSSESSADKANDGSTSGDYPNIYHSSYKGGFLRVDFARRADVTRIVLYPRTDCCGDRNNYRYTLYDGDQVVATGSLDARGGPVTVDVESDASASPGSWSVGAWNPWSSTCSASATRTRDVTCVVGEAAVDASRCPAPAPAASETGEQLSGCSYAATTTPSSDWSTCSGDRQSRSVIVACRRSDGQAVDASFCSDASSTETRTCVSAAPADGQTGGQGQGSSTSSPSSPAGSGSGAGGSNAGTVGSGPAVIMRRPIPLRSR
jgi:hypothetical protein